MEGGEGVGKTSPAQAAGAQPAAVGAGPVTFPGESYIRDHHVLWD